MGGEHRRCHQQQVRLKLISFDSGISPAYQQLTYLSLQDNLKLNPSPPNTDRRRNKITTYFFKKGFISIERIAWRGINKNVKGFNLKLNIFLLRLNFLTTKRSNQ